MITDNSSIAKSEIVPMSPAPAERSAQDRFTKGLDPNERDLGSCFLVKPCLMLVTAFPLTGETERKDLKCSEQ